MASNENECGVEERLNSFLTRLQLEYPILDRIVYKNKNQHRRGSYFQYLMKMRRDLRLLQSIRLEEILTHCFYVIDGKKPKQKVSALESLNKSMRDNGKHNFMERLLGAARLLSQMVEPMLKAASKISTVLAQSFFMSFSVAVLAIIARLRVVVQQILLDVVSIFNTVSSISHKRQSIKIIQEGVDVFREYYPKHKEMITLECVWEMDKFALIERKQEVEVIAQDMPPIASTVKYASIEGFYGDDNPGGKMADPKDTESMNTSVSNEETSDVASSYFNTEKQNDNEGLSKTKIKPHTHTESTDSHALDIPKPAIEPKSLKRKIDLKSRVAFVSVKKLAPATDDTKDALVQKANSSNDNPFSDVLNTGIPKSSVF
ncbi:unnamed protein product [Rhodiola kirilowii]